ncbi:MAG: hypothetical protein KF729_35830 [Sandaracinaceae bacterium]|nr:hypothetical protein [Sandaracinaceae bacterium]
MAFEDLHCEYSWASGADFEDCAFLARRWRDEYGTTLSDSDFLVCAVGTGDAFRYWGPTPNILSALWRALPSGRVYVADGSQGSVHVYDDVMSSGSVGVRSLPLTFAPEGIWGLDEQHVYAWGIGRQDGEQVPRLAKFDGRDWADLPAPSFFITKMHGLAPDLIYAAGRGGMARWNGRAWDELPMPTGEVLSDVFVAGPDEIYATGYAGSLLEGTANGWSIITRTVDERLPFACVIKFADELFVGGHTLGLYRRIGSTDQLDHIKPDIHASSFEARAGSLIITVPDEIIGTTDGEAFFGTAFEAIKESTAGVDIYER